MKPDHSLTAYTKINSKCIKDLNVRPETVRLLEENTGSMLSDIGFSNICLDMFPQTRETKAKINKWDYFKPKVSPQQRKPSMKRKPTKWEKIFANHISIIQEVHIQNI